MVMSIYIIFSIFWVDTGAYSFKRFQIFKLEIPLLLTLSMIFYFNIRQRSCQYISGLFPILYLYIIIDIFFFYLKRSPRISDFQNFSMLFELSYFFSIATLFIILLPLIFFVFLIYNLSQNYSKKKLFSILTLRIFFLSILICFLTSDIFYSYQRVTFLELDWSQIITIRENGRLSSSLFYYGNEKEKKKYLASYKNKKIDVANSLYQGIPIKTPNIHIIILESFIDPRMLKNITFNRSPLANKLQKYINNFSLLTSPVYGGDTAQAEFEILTGVKAYRLVSSIEFNIMNGEPINSFINKLTNHGYQTFGTFGCRPIFYNAKFAYKSLGIKEMKFLDISNFQRIKAGILNKKSFIFDGTLFQENIKRIKKALKKKKPILNYVLGLYGHLPYSRNKKIRPDVIDINPKIEVVQKISNQFYYRTKALGRYLKQLFKIDPDSIILIVSDHLPPILGNNIQYTQKIYEYRFVIFFKKTNRYNRKKIL